MRLKHLYIVLCIIGVVLPYTQFIPWVVENGLNVSLYWLTRSRLRDLLRLAG